MASSNLMTTKPKSMSPEWPVTIHQPVLASWQMDRLVAGRMMDGGIAWVRVSRNWYDRSPDRADRLMTLYRLKSFLPTWRLYRVPVDVAVR